MDWWLGLIPGKGSKILLQYYCLSEEETLLSNVWVQGVGSTLGQGTEVPLAMECDQNLKKKSKQCGSNIAGWIFFFSTY